MKNSLYLISLILILSYNLSSLPREEIDKIAAEGFLMYNLEKASWFSTDLLLAKYKQEDIKINGYLSYNLGKNIISIYYKYVDSIPMAFKTYTFKDTVTKENVIVDEDLRKLSDYEALLCRIRDNAIKEAYTKDTMFRLPKGSNFNTVLIRDLDTIKVFFLTSIDQKYVVPFGNDYLIKFSMDGSIIEKSKLHLGFLPMDYSKSGADSAKFLIHTHTEFSSPYITSTDICNYLLYGPKYSAGTIVTSKVWISLYYKSGLLVVSTIEDYNKIFNNKGLKQDKVKD